MPARAEPVEAYIGTVQEGSHEPWKVLIPGRLTLGTHWTHMKVTPNNK